MTTCKHVGVGLLREQGVEQADVAVLQHAAVVVHPRVLVPRVNQEPVVLACPGSPTHNFKVRTLAHAVCFALFCRKRQRPQAGDRPPG